MNAFLEAAFAQDHSVMVLSSCLNEVSYALHAHYMDEKRARISISTAAEVFELVDLMSGLVHEALTSDEPDYEDGLVRAAAESLEADAIITYDKKAFKGSRIGKLTASEALKALTRQREDANTELGT